MHKDRVQWNIATFFDLIYFFLENNFAYIQ